MYRWHLPLHAFGHRGKSGQNLALALVWLRHAALMAQELFLVRKRRVACMGSAGRQDTRRPEASACPPVHASGILELLLDRRLVGVLVALALSYAHSFKVTDLRFGANSKRMSFVLFLLCRG